jgi:hypothetical protein
MAKTTIILTLTDNKFFEVNGPLDNPMDRKLMIEMLQKGIDVCKNYKGGLIHIANGARYTEMDQTKVNHLARIKV